MLPALPTINSGEVYIRLVEQGMNCRSDNFGKGNSTATDLTWFFQSIAKLDRGDVMLVGGNWVMMDWGVPEFGGKSPVELWVDAMTRGATIVLLTSYYYTGNPDDCDGTAGSALDNGNWGPTGIAGCTDCGTGGFDGQQHSTCKAACCTIRYLKSKNPTNFIDLRNTTPLGGPSTHCKFTSFFYLDRGEYSVFFGAWNPVIRNWPLKETGMGYCGKLADDLGKYFKYFFYMLVGMIGHLTDPGKVDDFSRVQKLIDIRESDVPAPPIVVPMVFFYGPDYCDKNFGCEMNDMYGDLSRQKSNCGKQNYATLVDTNVRFSLGVAPSLLHHTDSCVAPGFNDWAKGWGGKGDKLIDALDLLVGFVGKSQKFVKSAQMTQYIGNLIALDDSIDCNTQDSVPKGLVDALVAKMKSGVPYMHIGGSGEGDYGANGGDGCANSQALAWKFACDPLTQKNFSIKNYGYGDTHDKFWVNENSLILSTGHTDTYFHMGRAYNYWLQMENCPNLVAWMNNHWNSMWTYCSFFPSDGKPSDGKPFNQALMTNIGKNSAYSSLMCPGTPGPLGCCFSESVSTNQILRSRSTANRYGDPSADIDTLRKSAVSGQLCVMERDKRVDCGVDQGWDQTKCLADPTCCYELLEDASGNPVKNSSGQNVPWCYGNSKKPIPGPPGPPGPGPPGPPGPDPALLCGKKTCPPFSNCVLDACVCFQGKEMSRDGTCVAAEPPGGKPPKGTVAWIVVLVIILIFLIAALVCTWKFKGRTAARLG